MERDGRPGSEEVPRQDGQTTTDDVDSVEFVLVSASGETYALEAGHVTEVVDATESTAVPLTPDSVEGVADVRGEVTAVIDGRVALGSDSGPSEPARAPPGAAGEVLTEEQDEGDTDQFVVFDRGRDRQSVGLRVDRVVGVETYPLSSIRRDATPPSDLDPSLAVAVVDREDEPALPVLDPEALSGLAA